MLECEPIDHTPLLRGLRRRTGDGSRQGGGTGVHQSAHRRAGPPRGGNRPRRRPRGQRQDHHSERGGGDPAATRGTRVVPRSRGPRRAIGSARPALRRAALRWDAPAGRRPSAEPRHHAGPVVPTPSGTGGPSAGRGPQRLPVIVLDDLQWCDDLTRLTFNTVVARLPLYPTCGWWPCVRETCRQAYARPWTGSVRPARTRCPWAAQGGGDGTDRRGPILMPHNFAPVPPWPASAAAPDAVTVVLVHGAFRRRGGLDRRQLGATEPRHSGHRTGQPLTRPGLRRLHRLPGLPDRRPRSARRTHLRRCPDHRGRCRGERRRARLRGGIRTARAREPRRTAGGASPKPPLMSHLNE
jgi:hypothetical protein